MSKLGSSSGTDGEYKGFKVGDYVLRKGRVGQITKIYWSLHPPSLSVRMLDNDTIVDTEFDYITKTDPPESVESRSQSQPHSHASEPSLPLPLPKSQAEEESSICCSIN